MYRGESGKWFNGNGYRLNLDREVVFIVPDEVEKREAIEISTYPIKRSQPFEFSMKGVEQEEVDFSLKQTYFFDSNKLNLPLTLRKWKQGDRIKPLGMKGSKLVSDVLIDAKVPQSQKEKVYVLVSKENISAIIGFGISEDFKLEADTRNIMSFSWKQ